MSVDKDYNFLMIVGTSIAHGNDMEASVDLDTLGVNFTTKKGMRIWKVEFGQRPDTLAASGAPAGFQDASTLSLRTITSGIAAPYFTDDGVIAQEHTTVMGPLAAGTSTSAVVIKTQGTVFPKGILVASDRLYLYDDNNRRCTRTSLCRIWYTLEQLTDSDFREMWEIWRRA